jgi:hypothetical protein
MTNPRSPMPPQTKTKDLIAEAFHIVTITLVGVLGVLTVAATI